ncbi:MAG: ZIP family metal transporter [Pirellulaceae bacterium]
MNAMVLLLIYSLLIVAASLLGGWLPTRFALTHVRMQFVLSLVGGLMLGIALLHLLPHAIAACNSRDMPMRAALAGLLFMFFLIRTFHFHHHDHEHDHDHQHDHQHGHGQDHDQHNARHPADRHRPQSAPAKLAAAEPFENVDPHALPVLDRPARDGLDSSHDHPTGELCEHGRGAHKLSWTGVALGLSVHTLIDGVALGAAVLADKSHGPNSLWGVGVFLAILLHKPLDALSITSLMVFSGWSAGRRNLINLGFALMCPIGAALVLFGVGPDLGSSNTSLGILLGFSAGVFLCISLSDLLPEVQFHQHDRFWLSAALLVGVALAYAIGHLEPASLH